MTKVLVLYYSMYGNVYRMAQAVAEGVSGIPGAAGGLELTRDPRRCRVVRCDETPTPTVARASRLAGTAARA